MIATILLEAWRAMGANRLRTFLTMPGMIIGVGAVQTPRDATLPGAAAP